MNLILLQTSNSPFSLKFFLILVFLIHFSAFSQNQILIDSMLLEEKRSPEDTLKVKLYNELSWEFKKIDAIRARKYANKAISLSKKLGYERGELEGLNRLGTLALYQRDYDLGIKLYKNILKREKEVAYQYGIGRALNQLADLYYRKGKLDKALVYAEKSLQVFRNAELNNKDSLMATVYSILGTIHTGKGNYEEAIKNLLQSLKIREKLGNDYNTALTLTKLGELNIEIKEYLRAKDYLIKSLSIFLGLNSDYDLAKTYNDLGIVAFYLGDYPNSKIYYEKSFSLKKELGLLEKDWIIYNNLSTLYFGLNDLESALTYGKMAENILKKQKITDQAEVSLNLGNIYHRKKMYSNAINYYRDALKITDSSKENILKFKILNNLLYVYHEVGNVKES